MAQRQSMYGAGARGALENTPIEQPITPRPTPINSDYLTWPTPPAYGSSSATTSSCALVNHSYSPSAHVGSSLACLRLKAQEFNSALQHSPYGPHQMPQ